MSSPRAPKGTYDLLPDAAAERDAVVAAAARVFAAYGYRHVVTPEFEETGLFERGVGEATDIVRKEMYTFQDKGDRSLTLRPEGTAPICRAYVEHGMHKLPQPVKLWYYCPMFRYEKPQAGRYREHYQIGAEAIGSADPSVDAEVILLLGGHLRRGRRRGRHPQHEQHGRPAVPARLRREAARVPARPRGRALRRLSGAHRHQPAAHVRLQGRELPRGARRGAAHVRPPLPGVPRALRRRARARPDGRPRAHTSTSGSCAVWTTTRAPSSSSIRPPRRPERRRRRRPLRRPRRAGRRPPTPGVGWGSGLERIALAMREPLAVPASTGVYVVAFDDDFRPAAFAVAESLRRAGVPAELDLAGRSPKGQFKQAGRSGARFLRCCSASPSSPTAPCGSRTLPAAGKRTSPPPTSRRSSPAV